MLAGSGVVVRVAPAQVLYGSILGTVTDEAGSSVPGAKVRITSVNTSQSREAETDGSGNYNFSSIPGDTYNIVVTKPGFQTFSVRAVTVAANASDRVDAVLKVGSIEQSIEVSAETLSLQTDSGEVRSEITSKSIENLPIPIGRNYQNLLITVPGVSPPVNQHSVAANPSRGLNFNVNGTTRNSNNVRIDGALANNVGCLMSRLTCPRSIPSRPSRSSQPARMLRKGWPAAPP